MVVADLDGDMQSSFDLNRFVEAQELEYESVLAELKEGEKCTHWMWFVFPQIEGLGESPMAQMYAVSSLDEARAYLEHEVLGARLEECTQLMLAVEGKSALEILGSPDDLKFRSCMTLFAECVAGESVFRTSLDKYFDGQPDQMTLRLLGMKA